MRCPLIVFFALLAFAESSCTKQPPATRLATPYDIAGVYDCSVRHIYRQYVVGSDGDDSTARLDTSYRIDVTVTAINEYAVELFEYTIPYPTGDRHGFGKGHNYRNGDSSTRYEVTFLPKKDSIWISQVDLVTLPDSVNGASWVSSGERTYSGKLRK